MKKNVRFSLGLSLVALIVAGALFIGYSPRDFADAPKPNFILILVDDLDKGMSEYWERANELSGTPISNCDPKKTVQGFMTCDPLRKTRALIKDEGITFDKAFVSTALCCPSRASIETGKYAHNTGVITNAGPVGGYQTFVQHGNAHKTVATHLQQANYRTAIMGKYLNGISSVTDLEDYPPGWSDMYIAISDAFYSGYNYTLLEKPKDSTCKTVEECSHTYGDKPEDYATDVIAKKAVDFIHQVSGQDQPFFLYVAPAAPHFPIPPAPRHEDNPYTHARITPAFWPNFKEKGIEDKSQWLQASAIDREKTIDLVNDQDYRNRLGALYAVDDLVEGIVNALNQHQLLDNTYIIFASDNGYNLGSHYLIHKMSAYEESISVPFIMRGPNINPNQVNNNLVLSFDLAPTILELAGINNEGIAAIQFDGASLAPLFNAKYVDNWRSDLLNEYILSNFFEGPGAEAFPAFWWFKGERIPSYRSIRTDQFTYISWYHGQDLVSWDPVRNQLVWKNINTQLPYGEELYDLKNDPFQLNNLLAFEHTATACANVLDILKERLQVLGSCKGKACNDPYPYADHKKDIANCLQTDVQ